MPRRKGISPVIATVIIVAVTIAVAIAVAFWMTGIIGLFTGFEQLQIVSIYDTQDSIIVSVKNVGTSTTSITDVLINGKSCVNLNACSVNPQLPVKVGTGETVELTLRNFQGVGNLQAGVSVEVKLLSAGGKEYPKLIVLQEYGTGSGGG